MLLWYSFGPKLTTYRTFQGIPYILIEAQQFLSSGKFEPANFLKKFLGFGHSEPQFSYKSFLMKQAQNLCIAV